MIVAIDGPAAAGKSSTARLVAQALGAAHLDSGALYRAVTAARARAPGEPRHWTEDDVLSAAERVSLRPAPGGFELLIDGVGAEHELRTAVVTGAVSRVAQMPAVRAWVNGCIRAATRNRDVVADGRDMGTAVFPDADLKIYLVADSWERARRRVRERTPGEPVDDDIAEEMARIVERDAKDSGQSAQAADAFVIDTTGLSQEEQVARIVGMARRQGQGPRTKSQA